MASSDNFSGNFFGSASFNITLIKASIFSLFIFCVLMVVVFL
nr:MAG TPA: hypothetical protein [Bacteriophage sp.]